jgi:ABC-type multidrug transport system permease subunit
MRLAQLLDKTAAIVRRDLLTAIRYRTGFLITAAGAAAELAAFYYLSRAIGPGFRPDEVDYFPFLLVGTGFYTFLVMGINAFLVIVQEAQQTGTLEILMTTSTPAPVLVFLSAISAFAGNTVQLTFYLGAGLLLFGAPLHANILGCVVIFALSLTIAVAIGILAAALTVGHSERFGPGVAAGFGRVVHDRDAVSGGDSAQVLTGPCPTDPHHPFP